MKNKKYFTIEDRKLFAMIYKTYKDMDYRLLGQLIRHLNGIYAIKTGEITYNAYYYNECTNKFAIIPNPKYK